MRTSRFSVETAGRVVVDVTDRVISFAREEGDDGLLHVFVLHATAAVALMETGSGSERDLEELLERLLPRDDRYTHRHGSPGHGADHLLPVLIPSHVVLPVQGGDVVLGTWQRVVLIDTNSENNTRTVMLSFLAG